MGSSDKYLVRRIRHSDTQSFKELFEKYYDRFFSFAFALLRDADAAEDILQNVFLKLWIGRSNLNENLSIENYLLVSIRNEIFNYLRLKHNKSLVRGEMPEVEDLSSDIDERINFNEVSYHLDRIISEMPPQRQKVFIMSRYRNMTTRQIADELGLSPRTVERHITIALKEIKSNLS